MEFLFDEIMNFSGHLRRLRERFFHRGPILRIFIRIHKDFTPWLLSTHLEITLLKAIRISLLTDLGKAINLVILGRFCPHSLVDVSHVGLEEQAVPMLVQDMVAFPKDLAFLGSSKHHFLA